MEKGYELCVCVCVYNLREAKERGHSVHAISERPWKEHAECVQSQGGHGKGVQGASVFVIIGRPGEEGVRCV